MGNQLMQWTNVNIKMSETQSAYELVKQLPLQLMQVCQLVATAIDRLPTCQDPKVVRDLENYKGCLTRVANTSFKATDSLLSKTRVVAALKGEQVDPGMLDVLLAAKQQVLELNRIIDGMENTPMIVDDLIKW